MGVYNYNKELYYSNSYIYTDRTLYKSADTINIWGFVPKAIYGNDLQDEFYISFNGESKEKINVGKDGNYNYINRAKMSPRESLMAVYDADVFLSSANAITSDGVMVNIDGNSNRVSCIAQGPKKVVFIVGMNKVCSDLDAAMKRARNVAAPANAQRFEVKTPCKTAGKCFDCKSPDTICCQFLITRYSRHKNRIHVILVNDTLGL